MTPSMTKRMLFVPCLFALTAGALAQDGTAAPTAQPSLTPLLIITISVLAVVAFMLWLVPKLTPRRHTPKAPHPEEDGKLSAQQQAIGAVTAFEKARLMGKKVAHASSDAAARGGEAGDEHPS